MHQNYDECLSMPSQDHYHRHETPYQNDAVAKISHSERRRQTAIELLRTPWNSFDKLPVYVFGDEGSSLTRPPQTWRLAPSEQPTRRGAPGHPPPAPLPPWPRPWRRPGSHQRLQLPSSAASVCMEWYYRWHCSLILFFDILFSAETSALTAGKNLNSPLSIQDGWELGVAHEGLADDTPYRNWNRAPGHITSVRFGHSPRLSNSNELPPSPLSKWHYLGLMTHGTPITMTFISEVRPNHGNSMSAELLMMHKMH